MTFKTSLTSRRPSPKKHIGIIHFRFAERDGVSLEIEKRLKILKKYPLRLTLIGGNRHPSCRTLYLPWLNLHSAKNKKLLSLFLQGNRFSANTARRWFSLLETRFQQQWQRLFEKENFDLLIIHNLLSLPLILPATTALVKALKNRPLPILAIHHDFWFNRDYFCHSPYRFVRQILNQLPPKAPFIHHQVINSLDQQTLKEKRGIAAEKISDYWDFSQKKPRPNPFNRFFLRQFGISPNDLFILQATRIVPRKAIENTIRFAAELQKLLLKTPSFRLHHKTITPRSRPVLFFSNFPDLNFHPYQKRLQQLARQLSVKTVWGYRHIGLKRKQLKNKKVFSFWDAYLFADLVVLSSTKEGFGNQFLEAVFFKKPLVLFEYPVFLKDLKPQGYHYISLGNRTYRRHQLNLVSKKQLRQAARQTLLLLQQPHLVQRWTTTNLRLAQKHYSLTRLATNLRKNVLKPLGIKVPSA